MKTDAQPEEVSGLLQEPEPQAEAPDFDWATAEPAPVVEQPEHTLGIQVEDITSNFQNPVRDLSGDIAVEVQACSSPVRI